MIKLIQSHIRAVGLCAAMLLVLNLNGCGTKTENNPVLLEQAILNSQKTRATPFWQEGVSGLKCAIIFINTGLQLNNTVFQASLRTNKGTRFAMFLAQGTKLGQCLNEGEKIICQSANIPSAKDILQFSFKAVHRLLLARPGPSDQFVLQYGDPAAGIDKTQLVLVREKKDKMGVIRVISNLEGVPLSVYAKHKNRLVWKISYSKLEESEASYFYEENSSSRRVRVRILEVFK